VVGTILAVVVLLEGAARPAQPGLFEVAPKLNPFADVAAKPSPFDPDAKPNPFELGDPKCNPFRGFYEV
jgi:hypothetical protein